MARNVKNNDPEAQLFKADKFKYIYTGDKIWCKYHFDYKRKWVVSSDDLDERTRPSNFEKKIMIAIFIGINGLTLLDFIPNGQSLTSDYFINNILKQL